MTVATTGYKKIQVKRYPSLHHRDSSESRYWKRFKFPVIFKEYGPVTSIEFAPTVPHDFAVASSTRVQIYSPVTNALKKTISRFKETVYSATYRHDGKLLAAGNERGNVQIFDLGSRAILRQYDGHTRGVHCVKFTKENTHLFTAGDDGALKCWDISTEQPVFSIDDAHTDYIRGMAQNAATPSMFATASYDHTVKLWDTRNNECTTTVDHGHPVEDCVILPSGGVMITAGGNEIKVWDLLVGGRLMKSFSNHQKTITSLCVDSGASRLLSASMDQHVKIYDITDYKVVHSIKYTNPILSMALSPNESHLAVGMSNGLLSVRHRVANQSEAKARHVDEQRLQGGSRRFFVRGKSEVAAPSDFKVKTQKKKKLAQYDVFMKKFQYRNALDNVLEGKSKGKHGAPVVMAVIVELIRRDALRLALAGRDETSLEPILSFLLKNLTNPRYVTVLSDVTTAVLDAYTPVLGVDMTTDELFVRLLEKVNDELQFQKRLMEIQGSLQLLVTS